MPTLSYVLLVGFYPFISVLRHWHWDTTSILVHVHCFLQRRLIFDSPYQKNILWPTDSTGVKKAVVCIAIYLFMLTWRIKEIKFKPNLASIICDFQSVHKRNWKAASFEIHQFYRIYKISGLALWHLNCLVILIFILSLVLSYLVIFYQSLCIRVGSFIFTSQDCFIGNSSIIWSHQC